MNHSLDGGRKPVAPRWSLLATLLLCAGAHAQQGGSMEERLRTQLRVTTTQLQQAQNELAALKAAGPTTPASGEIDAMKAELSKLKAELAGERAARQKTREESLRVRDQAEGVLEKSSAQVAQYRNAYDELLKLARNSEAERQRLIAADKLRGEALAQCEAKNLQLYETGKEILRAYETMDVATVMSARQPFAGAARVKLEEAAQQYGDTLYSNRFDSSSVKLEEAK